MICEKCGAEINEGGRSCSFCGEEVKSDEPFNQPSGLINCMDCGNSVSKKAKTCPNCGCPVV